MPLTQARYDQLVDVPRSAWDPTEGHHSRHGERGISGIYGLEVHWDGSPGDLTDHGDTADELLSFERYHEVSKGWYDLFYNLGADVEGNIYEGRDVTIPSQGDLYAWMTLLCVTGVAAISPAEELVIARSIYRAWGAVDPSRSPSSLRGHGERNGASSSCPGPQILNIISRLRDGWVPEGTSMDHSHNYQDLTDHPDAVAAKDEGIWNGENGAEAASRSTVAVVAQRVLDKARDSVVEGVVGPRGPAGPKGDAGPAPTTAQVREAIRDEKQYLVNLVKAEIAKDLTS
jgi:hypothetical protein